MKRILPDWFGRNYVARIWASRPSEGFDGRPGGQGRSVYGRCIAAEAMKAGRDPGTAISSDRPPRFLSMFWGDSAGARGDICLATNGASEGRRWVRFGLPGCLGHVRYAFECVAKLFL